MARISFDKSVFNKDDFDKLINRNFNQLINNIDDQESASFTLDDFFQLYENLFYQIPKEGDTNSHRYILEKEAEYLGVIINQDDIQALLDEITVLRQQVIDTQTALDEISKTIK
jgi:hypothetical protein